MPLTQAQVVDALRPVQDPELHRSIVDLGMVKDVTIAGSDIKVQVALTVPGCPLRAEIDQRVTDAIRGLDAGATVAVDFTRRSQRWDDAMDALSLFGLFAVTAMLVSYALEDRSHWYIAAFAVACALGSVYGFLQGAWPFGLVEIAWTLVAVRRWMKRR